VTGSVVHTAADVAAAVDEAEDGDTGRSLGENEFALSTR